MKVLFVLLIAATAQATSFYEDMAEMMKAAPATTLKDIDSAAVWTGECARSHSPNHLIEGLAVLYSVEGIGKKKNYVALYTQNQFTWLDVYYWLSRARQEELPNATTDLYEKDGKLLMGHRAGYYPAMYTAAVDKDKNFLLHADVQTPSGIKLYCYLTKRHLP